MAGGLIPRILIVSQNCVIRAGLRTLLGESGGYHSVAEASSCEAPLLQTLRTRPHIVLLEAGARLKDDISAVLSVLPDAAVVAFSREDREELLRDSLAMGVHGFVTCPEDNFVSLLGVLERVRRGERAVCTASLSHLIRTFCSQPSGSITRNLTAREMGLLQLLATGIPNREIASLLHLSVGTVKNLLTQIRRKLDVRTRAAAAARASELLFSLKSVR